jgi:hypothetical protein
LLTIFIFNCSCESCYQLWQDGLTYPHPQTSFDINISCSTMSDEYGSPPRTFGRIARPMGYLPLNTEDSNPMATHGKGILNSLIKSRSHTSLTALHRRPSSFREGRDTQVFDEEIGPFERMRRNSRDSDEPDDFKRSEERRLSIILNGPQMRSQRLIGNSNPRYRWERYWKTEEELKTMKKPL